MAGEALEQARRSDGLAISPPSADALAKDWAVQRYVFDYKRAPNVNRFSALREAGVFDHPPELERVDNGVRARGWAAMTFLERAARRHGTEIAEILTTLQSDNWWVISDGLGIASRLPRGVRTDPILHLFDLWQGAPIKWIQPRQASQALAALAEVEGSDRALEAALTQVSVILLDDRQNSPDLEEILSGVFERLGPDYHDALLTGIETALAMPAVRSRGAYRYERDGLRNASRGSADALDAMLALWVQMIDARSTQERSSELLVGRAVRLLAAEPVLLRQMGIVALDAALAAKPGPSVVDRVFNEWISDVAADWLTDWRYTADLLDLLRTHQRRLALDPTASLIELGLTWAASSEEREQWRAWYLLGALRQSLGPRERMILANLESTRGEATGRVDPMRVSGGWVRERSAIPPEDLAQMSPREIVDATTYVPSIADDDAFSDGATVSGFAQALKSQFLARAGELVPVAADIAMRASDAAVIYQVAWALREMFSSSTTAREGHRNDVLKFVSALRDRVGSARSTGSDDVRSMESALADLLESLCDWLDADDSDTAAILVSSLGDLLESADPAPDGGFADDDPPMRAVNSVRGTAVLAALRLASSRRHRGQDVTSILELLRRNVASETDLGVLSAYGRYLGSLAVYWPDFLSTHRQQLLPPSRDGVARWQAVFITYVAFNSPHVEVAPRLVHEYSRAVDELGEGNLPRFFSEHVNRLIGHLSGLALPGAPDDPIWSDLLVRALTTGPADGVAQVVHDLAFAVQREGLEVPDRWLLDLVHPNIDALRQRPPAEAGKVARAWVELLLAARIRLASAGGALVALTNFGGSVDENDLVDYLSVVDRPRSRMGARLLRDAAVAGSFDGDVRDPSLLRRLVGQYARAHRDLGWEIVNRLGRAGLFGYESLARMLRSDVPSSESPSS
jgi:hypothetical protein